MDIGAQEHVASRGTIGILGAGRVGTAIARLAVAAGYRVNVATSKPAADNALIIEIVTPGAVAVDAAEAAASDLVVVAIPLHKYKSLNADVARGQGRHRCHELLGRHRRRHRRLRGRRTCPPARSWPPHLAGSRVVKSFNHIGYHEMEPDAAAPGTPDRRALAVAGDDAERQGTGGRVHRRPGLRRRGCRRPGGGQDPLNPAPRSSTAVSTHDELAQELQRSLAAA